MEIDFQYKALFKPVKKDDGTNILDSSIYDGDTIFGKRKPDPEVVIAKDSTTRSDDVSRDGDYYRLNGVDTHEINSSYKDKRQMAAQERHAVMKFIDKGMNEWKGDWPFILAMFEEGPFGRPIVDLYRRSDGKSLNHWLVNEKFEDRNISYE